MRLIIRHITPLLLLLLLAATSCHTSKKAQRKREARARQALIDEHTRSHKKFSTDDYVLLYKQIAVTLSRKYGLPASIILAQGILESGNGNSDLAREANNHFGIKCTSDWKGLTCYHDDETKHECFRKYPDVEASYKDHSDFLQRKRYIHLFSLATDDYKAWAYGLKKAGYATNPKYPELLINLIEKYKLYDLDE